MVMLKRDALEYKQIISSLDEEQALDLAVHLYSTALLRRIDPSFPPQKWSLWPLPYSEVPDPDDGFHYQDDLIPAGFLNHEPYEAYALFRDDMDKSKTLRLITRASNQLKLLRGKRKIIERLATLDGLDPGILTKRENRDRLRGKRICEARLLLYPIKPKVRIKRTRDPQQIDSISEVDKQTALKAAHPDCAVASTRGDRQDRNTSGADHDIDVNAGLRKLQSVSAGNDQAGVSEKPWVFVDETEHAKEDYVEDKTSSRQAGTDTNLGGVSFVSETGLPKSKKTNRGSIKKQCKQALDFGSSQSHLEDVDSDTQKDSDSAIKHPRPHPSLEGQESEHESDFDLDYTEDIKLANKKRAMNKDSEWMVTKAKYNIIQNHPNSKGRLLSAIGAEIERSIAKKIRQKVEKGEIREGNSYNANLLDFGANKAMAVVIASKLDNLLNTISSLQSPPRLAATKTWRHVLVAAVESEESPYKLFKISPYDRVYPKCEQLFENICYKYKLQSDEAAEESESDSEFSSKGFNVYKYLEKLDAAHGTSRLDRHFERRKWEQVELQTMKNLFYSKLSLQLSARKVAWYSKSRDLLRRPRGEERNSHPRLRYTIRNEGISSTDYVRPGLENI